MNGYSRDSSDLLSSPEKTPNFKTSPKSNQSFETEFKSHDSNGKRFRALKLNRNGSISPSSFKLGSNSENLQSAVRRAFSARRCSSVSERYCRIYDQDVALASPIDDELESVPVSSNGKKKMNSGGKILKACKRIFGL